MFFGLWLFDLRRRFLGVGRWLIALLIAIQLDPLRCRFLGKHNACGMS